MDYSKEIVALRTSLEELEKKLSLVRKSASVDYQTQIDQMKSDVNACQNSLTSIEQDLLTINNAISTNQTSIETNANDISTISTQIENIQTALTTCQGSVSTLETQVSTLQFDMSVAKGNITYITTTLNVAVFDLELLKVTVDTARTDIINLKSQMSTAQTDILANASDIDTLQSQMTTAQSDISANAGDIDTLQSSMSTAQADISSNATDISTNASAISSLQSSLSTVAFSGDYDDLINKPSESGGGSSGEEDEMANEVMTSSSDEYYDLNESELSNDNNEIRHEKIYFICSPEMYIEGNVDVYLYSFQNSITSTVRLYYENDLVFEKTATLTAYDQIFNFPFKIYPKARKGYFRITIVYHPYIFIKNSTFHITSAKNMLFLDNNYRWTVTVYKHKYYIGKNKKFNNDYYLLTADNFDFSNPYSCVPITTCATYFPKPTFTNGVLSIDENYVYCQARSSGMPDIHIFDVLATTVRLARHHANGCGITYFTDDGLLLKSITVTHVNLDTGELSYWSGQTAGTYQLGYKPYKVNDVLVEANCWVANNPVQQLDMDNAPYNVFQGSVAVRDDGMCIYFPHYNATYTIELGIGRRPTAYRQENGDLHIYIGRTNYVVKFVLKKNASTNQYEITSQEKIYGVEQYFETLDNKAIHLINDEIKLVDL